MIKNIFSEFKKFAMRGNVMDMAVGIIIGAAFTKIVDSLVKDILMPPLGLLMGKIDFANLFFVLKNGTPEAPYASIDAAKAAGASFGVGQHLHLFPLHGLVFGDDHLGDTLTMLYFKGFCGQVDKDDLDFPAIVGIDGAG